MDFLVLVSWLRADFLLWIKLLTKTEVFQLGSWNFSLLSSLSTSVFILVRYLLVLFWLSFDRFGNIMCEVTELDWASMEHGLNYLRWVEGQCPWIAWADHGQVLSCIVASSHKTCIPYIVRVEYRSIPGQFDTQNLVVVPPDSHDGVTSECGLAVPCQFTFFPIADS